MLCSNELLLACMSNVLLWNSKACLWNSSADPDERKGKLANGFIPGKWPGNDPNGGKLGGGGNCGIMLCGTIAGWLGPELLPSCGEIFLRTWGVCNFGLGLAECLFRDLLELNIMLQPSTVHLCIIVLRSFTYVLNASFTCFVET